MRAVICMPEQANPVKVESMRALGAEVVFHGRDFDEAREYCQELAAEHEYRYIHSGNEPEIIAAWPPAPWKSSWPGRTPR